jgi:hypothetical protein
MCSSAAKILALHCFLFSAIAAANPIDTALIAGIAFYDSPLAESQSSEIVFQACFGAASLALRDSSATKIAGENCILNAALTSTHPESTSQRLGVRQPQYSPIVKSFPGQVGQASAAATRHSPSVSQRFTGHDFLTSATTHTTPHDSLIYATGDIADFQPAEGLSGQVDEIVTCCKWHGNRPLIFACITHITLHYTVSDISLQYPNPTLYSLPPGSLRDIITGGNGAYDAGVGWDACTGLGTPPANLAALLGV